ncbi:MAG: hypothetical protein ACRCX7_14760 [Cetobacterium sp.]|uniref:hypothetical protein n=1 Tax=Cetobacterium sp. TaxID=2071632 RepID=UPI003F338BE2
MDKLLVERAEKETKSYEKIKAMYEFKMRVYESLDINVYEDNEEYVSKLYILFNNIKKVADYMNEKGDRIQNEGSDQLIKIRPEYLNKILRGLGDDERNEYKRLARIQYKANGGVIRTKWE